jgi:hypothetical protein
VESATSIVIPPAIIKTTVSASRSQTRDMGRCLGDRAITVKLLRAEVMGSNPAVFAVWMFVGGPISDPDA